MTFQVGDKVIYPNHGLGIVERIEEKTILGTTCGFFHLRIVSNDTTVLVPVANVDGVGLRKAITDEEVERLFSLLSDGKIDNHQNWKGRFKDNSDKMRTGSIYDMADVLKSLTFLSKSKSLSFREKRMLDRARALIISEISEVIREKAIAPIGNSIASAATDAANSAAAARMRTATTEMAFDGAAIRVRACSTSAAVFVAVAGKTRRIASVAPKVSRNARSAIDSGSAATSTPAASASTLNGALR